MPISNSLSVADDVRRRFASRLIFRRGTWARSADTREGARFQIAYVSDEVDSRRTQGAVGDLTTNEALTKLLSGTGLTYRYFVVKRSASFQLGGRRFWWRVDPGTGRWFR